MNLPIFKLEDYLATREFSAPYMFCASDMETHTMSELLAMADEECQQLWNTLDFRYTETTGHPLLRQDISQMYADSITSEHVLCFAGAEEGIFCAAQSLLTPEDHAIVAVPCYQSLAAIPGSLCETTPIHLHPENQWQLDVEEVKRRIRPNTKLILINYPHNPTGTLIDSATQHALVELARANDIYIFSDEVYRLLEVNDQDRLEPIANVYEKGLSLGVMSKSLGLPGLRIGWIATQEKAVLHQCSQMKHYLTICNSAPSEILSMMALRAREQILERNRQLMRTNLRQLEEFFESYADRFEWVRPQGGCTGFPELKMGGMTIDTFADQLLDQEGVVILPASVYDLESNHFRVSFGRSHMPEALSRFQRFVDGL